MARVNEIFRPCYLTRFGLIAVRLLTAVLTAGKTTPLSEALESRRWSRQITKKRHHYSHSRKGFEQEKYKLTPPSNL